MVNSPFPIPRGQALRLTDSKPNIGLASLPKGYELNQKIRELSRGSESNVTRGKVAKALKLSNAKALDRLRRQFGDDSRWHERIAKAMAV